MIYTCEYIHIYCVHSFSLSLLLVTPYTQYHIIYMYVHVCDKNVQKNFEGRYVNFHIVEYNKTQTYTYVFIYNYKK